MCLSIFIVIILLLGYKRASLSVWTLSLFLYLLFFTVSNPEDTIRTSIYWALFIIIASVMNYRFLRRLFISKYLLKTFKKAMPKISATEQEAIKAGTVSWGRELFSGQPKWETLKNYPAPQLSEEEKAFIDGPVNTFCAMINDWEITHMRADLSPEMWKFLKENGFFSFIIPKQYGGKEFSTFGISEILAKLYGMSITAGSTVAVPNSLGPAELLMRYGTKEQREYYLPRLARGEEIPCFALTSDVAGSDASSITDHGIVCKKTIKGKEQIGIRLTWSKRYITLAPVATLLGLAFKLFDPDHLIGNKENVGITCALIPTSLPGVKIGRRHFPLNNPFMNGPTQGEDVFISIDSVIGGIKMVGQGWRMLMECLSVGRAVTLPASAIGGAKVATFVAGAYARIREQFNMPLGLFEGIEEVLTRIAANTYIIDAARKLTATLFDIGEKPAVPSAIVKYHTTERARMIANDVMDIHGGKGICLGPRNYIARNYEGLPISITVEGANILTRCMIIFGQGAIRCHPYILHTLEAALNPDTKQGLIGFDQSLFSHMGLTISNFVRSLLLGLSCSKLAGAPSGHTKKYYQQLTRFSAAFAVVADLALITLGAELKRREKLSGRLSDIFSMLYLGTAVLKHFETQGQHEEDLPLVHWCMQNIIDTMKIQFHQVIKNFPNRFIAFIMRVFVFPLGCHLTEPSDKLGKIIAKNILANTPMRERLTSGIYLDKDVKKPVSKIAMCFQKVLAAEQYETLVKQAFKRGEIGGLTFEDKVKASLEKKIISKTQADVLLDMHQCRMDVIAVDDFDPEDITNPV